MRRSILASLCLAVSLVTGCAVTIENLPVNDPADLSKASSKDILGDAPRDIVGENVIALSFSGGGMRAAAFAFGALKALEAAQTQHQGLLDDVTFITSVSGGSLTAAYYGLHGKETLGDFREKVLLRDIEVGMRLSAFAPTNILRLLYGGLNDRSNLASWLDKQVFKGATFADIYRHSKPDIWINATDVFNRTPFLFTPPVFSALCSDLSSFGVAEAVHASMAVPLVFAPVVLKTYPDRCSLPLGPWVDSSLASADAPNVVKATARALQNYRNPAVMKYVKLVDGGVTDNFGLTSILIGRSASGTPYGPLSARDAVHMKRMLFLVIDAGRGPRGDWALSPLGPSGLDMALAATDTAIDTASRVSYDTFKAMMRQWQQSLVEFRCELSAATLQRMGVNAKAWDCRDVMFEVGYVSFADLPAERNARLDAIPTRLTLPAKDIDDAISAGMDATQNNPAFNTYLKSRIAPQATTNKTVKPAAAK
jgi:NTE family protein